MTDAELRARRLASHLEWLLMLGRASKGAQAIELPGVAGSVVPARPDRSVVNAVAYDDAAALLGALEEVAARYEAAGIQAWTVWVPEEDRHVAEALEAAGHVLDGVPRDMGAVLADMDLEPRGEIEVERDPAAQDIAEINEAAYYSSAGGTYFGPAFAGLEGNLYMARLDGRPASSTVIFDSGENAYVQIVATRPEAQRRGMAAELMRLGLRDARDRGLTTTTLEATAAGAPVYTRLGYRDLGVVQMWERRVRNESA